MKARLFHAVAAGLLLGSFVCDRGTARQWEDNAGKSIEAEFVRMKDGWVELAVSNKVVRVPFRNLSPADQTHARSLAADQMANALVGQLEGLAPKEEEPGADLPAGPADPAPAARGDARPRRGDEAGGDTARRGKKEIEAALKAIDPGGSRGTESERATALLNAYRYLCGLAFDVQTDGQFEAISLAGAKLCEAIGRLDHVPANPGWADEEYRKGYQGTSQGNLFSGGGGAVASVHAYMNDSGGDTMPVLGHRRWCLNPGMLKTGFGTSGSYSCMHAVDSSRGQVPDWEMVAYPAPGFFPISYFGARHAWSITLNPNEFRHPEEIREGQIKVCRVHDSGKLGDEMQLVYSGVDHAGYGVANCIIFLPKDLDLGNGKRYRVEVADIKKKSGKTVTLSYEVEFFND
ncbi:MAG: SHD1 domain-containing protein [Kiritimatiellia bacterium]